jgi:hypothetical protein
MWELYQKGTLLKILASKEQLILAEAASMQRSGVDFRESLAVALGNNLWEPPEEDRPKTRRLSQKRWMMLRDWIDQVVEVIPS